MTTRAGTPCVSNNVAAVWLRRGAEPDGPPRPPAGASPPQEVDDERGRGSAQAAARRTGHGKPRPGTTSPRRQPAESTTSPVDASCSQPGMAPEARRRTDNGRKPHHAPTTTTSARTPPRENFLYPVEAPAGARRSGCGARCAAPRLRGGGRWGRRIRGE
jgi:hypothetical protein